MPSFVDLRSDTVTRPDAGMRAAMAAAEVGDDVLGDDPTVQTLQQRVATMFGVEAALFVPSGTMANQLAIKAATEPGDEIILDDTTHSYNYETGATAALAGCSMRVLHTPRGIFQAADVEAAIRPDNVHTPRTRMVIVENTNNRGGGAVWPRQRIAEIRELTRARGLHLHLDGARLMNACVATGDSPRLYGTIVDSVSLCFSKGLGAPIGSVIAGRSEFVRRCHRYRKMYGGAMRQVGILAAAASYALDRNVERLAADHANAKRLAEGLAAISGIRLNPADVETNIVIFEVDERLGAAEQFAERLAAREVRLLAIGPRRLRGVTHLDVSTAQIDAALAAFRDAAR